MKMIMKKLIDLILSFLRYKPDIKPVINLNEEIKKYNLVNENLLKLHNDFRKAHNKDGLQLYPELIDEAQKWAENMANKNKMYHDRLKSTVFSYLAENIAMGVSTEKQVFDMWKNSLGHRNNILGRYTSVGFGMSQSKNGYYYWCAKFGA